MSSSDRADRLAAATRASRSAGMPAKARRASSRDRHRERGRLRYAASQQARPFAIDDVIGALAQDERADRVTPHRPDASLSTGRACGCVRWSSASIHSGSTRLARRTMRLGSGRPWPRRHDVERHQPVTVANPALRGEHGAAARWPGAGAPRRAHAAAPGDPHSRRRCARRRSTSATCRRRPSPSTRATASSIAPATCRTCPGIERPIVERRQEIATRRLAPRRHGVALGQQRAHHCRFPRPARRQDDARETRVDGQAPAAGGRAR